jgi:HEAT repeat protein
VPSRILAILIAYSIAVAFALPLAAATGAEADLSKLFADAAKYQSGQSAEPMQKIEQLLRDSATKPALRAELEDAAVRLLDPSASFEARRFACQILAVVGTNASLPALAELLKSEETVGIACLALSARQSPKVNEILRDALPSARGRTRLQIIGALGNHRDAQSVTALAELARDADAAVAETAILALGKIGGAAAHEAVAALRKEAKPAHAWAVTEATSRVAQQLVAAGDRKGAAAIYAELLQPKSPTNVRRGALAALMNLDDDGGQKRILDTLAGGDPALVPVAIARVSSLKSGDASKTFAAKLPGLPPPARAWMIEALAARRDAAAREAIRAELSAADAGVRRAAIAAVGRLEDASAVGLLTKTLAVAKSPEEIQDVEMALAGLRGGKATDAALVAELKQVSAEARVRLFSVLARRGARVAVPALLAEAGGSDVATARAALQALARIAAADDLPALLEALVSLKTSEARADAGLAAARAMAKIADVSRRSETVREALEKNTDVEARCSLLRLLPGAADGAALAVLKAACSDKEPQIRDAAVRALAAWPDATGWDAILAVYDRPENDAHRAVALRGLVRLATDLNAKPDAALVQRYRQLLSGARGNNDLKLILSALAGAAPPDALQHAEPLLSNAGVRAEAELAVKKIAASVQAQHPQAAQAALERLKQAKP